MKILLYIPTIGSDGMSKIILDIANRIKDDYDIEILTLKVKDSKYINNSIKIHETGIGKNLYQRYKKVKEIMSKNNYDIVHINASHISRLIECFAAKRTKNKKIILHSHASSSDLLNSRLKRFLHQKLKFLYKYVVTDFIACSTSAAEWLFPKDIYQNSKYTVIKNGIDIDQYKYNQKIRDEIRKKYHITDKFVIGNVGRFSEVKNHKFLIDIFNEYKKINNDSMLLLIGNGDLKNEIEKKIDHLELNDSVIILDYREDIYKYYHAMDCFVLPSFQEGLGLVNIEAQTSGLPVIVSTGVPKEAKVSELIEFVDLSYESEYWAKKIKKNFHRKEVYKQVITNKYDINSSVEQLKKIYGGK